MPGCMHILSVLLGRERAHVQTKDNAQRTVAIVERHQAGESLRAIAKAAMDLNCYMVRKWWRVYGRAGWAGLVPKATGHRRPANWRPLIR